LHNQQHLKESKTVFWQGYSFPTGGGGYSRGWHWRLRLIDQRIFCQKTVFESTASEGVENSFLAEDPLVNKT
jgi:hypothetical protein